MKTVDLVLEMHDVNKADTKHFFEKLQYLQDVPCDDLLLEDTGERSLMVTIRYPLTIFDQTVSQFMAALFGEFPYMRSFGNARFIDLRLPDEVWGWFGGPTFGAEGIKARVGGEQYPITMAIIKPSISSDLTAERIHQVVAEPIAGGFDFVKDDEMQGDFPYAPLADRVALASQVQQYVPTLNLDSATGYTDILADENIGMVLLNATVIGFPMLQRIASQTKVPILSHLSLQGTYMSTFSPKLIALLHRLFGCDALITPIGDTEYYRAAKADELEMARALTSPAPGRATLPFLTGGGTIDNVQDIMAPYEADQLPYGLVFGTQVFGSDQSPETMAAELKRLIQEKQAQP